MGPTDCTEFRWTQGCLGSELWPVSRKITTPAAKSLWQDSVPPALSTNPKPANINTLPQCQSKEPPFFLLLQIWLKILPCPGQEMPCCMVSHFQNNLKLVQKPTTTVGTYSV